MDDQFRLHAREIYHTFGLTSREVSICDRLLTGESNGEIAYELGIAESTVKNAMTNIMQKLGTRDRLETGLVIVGVIPASELPDADEDAA